MSVLLNLGFVGGTDYVPVQSLARKRWHLAFAAIYSCRAFLSLDNGDSLNKSNTFLCKLLRSPSYTSVDVEPDGFSNTVKIRLAELMEDKSANLLGEFGWVEGVVQLLESNAENGIDGYVEDIARRRKVFGSNVYVGPPAKSFFCFLLQSFTEPTILILLLCAALSAGFGINNYGLRRGWYEGITKLFGVSLVATVAAGSMFWPHRQFHWLYQVTYNQIEVDAIRNRHRQKISISKIVVGDVLFLKPNDKVPANGLLLGIQTLQVAETSTIGANDLVTVDPLSYPFLLCGARVVDGYARMLVTGVGLNTIREDELIPIGRVSSKQTYLAIQLQKLTSLVGKGGLAVAFLVLLVTLIRYFTGNIHDEEGNRLFIGGKTKIHHVLGATLGILATPLMIASTTAPDGLTLSLSISLAYYMRKMIEEQAIVRDSSLLRTTRAVTTICVSKTGILTLDQMKVTKFWLGLSSIEDSYHLISPHVLELLQIGIGLNTTPPTMKSSVDVPSDPTEKAVFEWAVQRLGMDTQTLSQSWKIRKIEAFKSEKRKSEVFIRWKDGNTIYVHQKGAPEVVLATCSYYYGTNGDVKLITDTARMRLERILKGMVAIGLRCIAYAYIQMPTIFFLNGKSEEVLKTNDWTLLGFVGLQNPCAPGVKEAVRSCYKADLDVKMITGDNIFTARAIAAESGILEADQPGLILEGAEFENYTLDKRLEKVDNIRVMARASPFQKFLMVECLKKKGHGVAFVGHSDGDTMALWKADIRLCLRNHGSAKAEESSGIVLIGDFASAVTALFRWDRGMLENIQIFIQFQLTATIVSLVIDSLTAISSGDLPTNDFVTALSSGKVPYPALQLLWVKLIIGPLAAMALILDQSFEELIKKKPRDRTRSLVSRTTWRNIVVQVLYQIFILLTIHFNGKSVFSANAEVKGTLIFNVFVLCQVFNMLSARFLEKNSFKEIQRKKVFGGIIGIIIVIQVVMVEFLKRFANTERLEWGHWCICIGIAAGSWLFGWLVNHVADRKERFFSYHKRDDLKHKNL